MKPDPAKASALEWLRDMDLNTFEGQLNGGGRRVAGTATGGIINRNISPHRSRLHIWLIRLSTSILLWTCLIQLIALVQLWQPQFLSLKVWPSCLNYGKEFVMVSVSESVSLPISPETIPPPLPFHSSGNSIMDADSETISTHTQQLPRIHENNGYLLISCNGGLNQMRAAICDMVAIAKLLNVTLMVPELDKTSFWADPSDFHDIFDVNHFVLSLQDEVRIIKHVPTKYHEVLTKGTIMSMPPVSWSNELYYLNQILPLVKKQKVLRFSKTDTRLANAGLSLDIQKLRCRANYEALRFTPAIERLGQKLVKYLKAKGPFLVLHLRYEMDMLAFSGCTHGCTESEADELTKMRYAYPWWKEKVIESKQKRLEGLCPLTPEETALTLQALRFDKSTQIYIAAGDIYGSERRMASLFASFPNIVRKEVLLSPYELRSFQNHSSQMAALDYLVSIESDVFIPTFDGNMAKVVEGHRRFLGFRKTITLDRKRLVELVDQYQNNTINWKEFSALVSQAHHDRMGAPRRRVAIPDRPKEEDYFYSNPEECFT